MGTLHILDDQRPHITGPARCIACRHEWTAVALAGTEWLQCPSCALVKGVFALPVCVSQGETRFVCRCGADSFYLMATRKHRCMKCGLEGSEWPTC
jgi:DNA-directed RNA polymerase subunit RPC12/RpoP